MRPKMYKQPPVWQVDEVLETILSWGNNLQLDTKHLTLKLAMLFALVSAGRGSETSRLSMKTATRLPEGVRFKLLHHKKNLKSSEFPGTIFIPTYPENLDLCPVQCMDWYLAKTAGFRVGINADIPEDDEDLLFRSMSQPLKGITSKTFSRWVTECIATSLDSSPSGSLGHSARGSATTKAFIEGHLTLKEIMDGANWRTESVFHKFYKNPDFNPNFGRSVLAKK